MAGEGRMWTGKMCWGKKEDDGRRRDDVDR